MNVQELLEEKKVNFEVIPHKSTYDAQHLAHEVHVSGHDVAKTVLLRVGDKPTYVVAALPASRNIDLAAAKQALGEETVELATEDEIQSNCPDCEFGALPPFGSRYGMKTLVDESLANRQHIVFEGNTHEEAIRMTFEDFQKLESLIVADFATDAGN